LRETVQGQQDKGQQGTFHGRTSKGVGTVRAQAVGVLQEDLPQRGLDAGFIVNIPLSDMQTQAGKFAGEKSKGGAAAAGGL
jgi:hypothetical protein